VKAEPCDACDFIGPLNEEEQGLRYLHRAWHEFGRAWNRAAGALTEALRKLGEAVAEERAKEDYRLAGPSKGDSK
jgi:hypothetical protein